MMSNALVVVVKAAVVEKAAVLYATKPGHFETSKIHFPTSKEVSKVSERASERVIAAEGASEASSLEQANK